MIEKLTQEQEALIPQIVEKWTKIGLATDQVPHDEVKAIVRRFEIEVLERAERPIIIVDSPYACWTKIVELNGGTKEAFVWPYVDGHWSVSYFAWVDFWRQCGIKNLPANLDAFMGMSRVGLYYPLENWTVVCQKPIAIHRNAAGQLHKDGAKALEYADGWGVYCLNGVRVSKAIAETRAEELDAKLALQETNAEIRREIIRKIGVERFIQKAGAKTLDKDGNYELLSVDLSADARGCRFLKMLNPSIGVWHVEGVDPDCKTVADALRFRQPEAMKAIPVSEDGEDWFQQGDVCVWPKGAKSLKPRPSELT